jgi:hypothetical protein
MKPLYVDLQKPNLTLAQPRVQLGIALLLVILGLAGLWIKWSQGTFVLREDFLYPVLVLMGLVLSVYFARAIRQRGTYFIRVSDQTITYRTAWEDEKVTVHVAAVDNIDVELFLLRFYMKSGVIIELDLSEESIDCEDLRRLKKSVSSLNSRRQTLMRQGD